MKERDVSPASKQERLLDLNNRWNGGYPMKNNAMAIGVRTRIMAGIVGKKWMLDFRTAILGQDLYKFLFAEQPGVTP